MVLLPLSGFPPAEGAVKFFSRVGFDQARFAPPTNRTFILVLQLLGFTLDWRAKTKRHCSNFPCALQVASFGGMFPIFTPSDGVFHRHSVAVVAAVVVRGWTADQPL